MKLHTFITKIFFAALLAVLAVSANAGITVTYFHNDLTGSPVAATNETGQVVWRKNYTPYGETAGKDRDNRVGYTGHQEESNGLVYAGARYYDPALGRFMSVDPKGFSDQNPMSFNRYAYANNNPYKYVDPDGRDASFSYGVLPNSGVDQKTADGVVGLYLTAMAVSSVVGIESGAAAVGLSEVLYLASGGEFGGAKSPHIDPKSIAGKTAQEIDQTARNSGLLSKGSNPMEGKGSYVDPATGKQRVLIHPEGCDPHCHVNNPAGERLDIGGKVVPPESRDAHLPLRQ